MANKKESSRQRIQIGSSSLLLIFTVLCLVVFGTLSLSSAKADHKLALKTKSSVEAFYEADCKGEELKKQVDQRLLTAANLTVGKEEMQEDLRTVFGEAYDEQEHVIRCSIDMGDEQFLLIELALKDYEQISEEQQNFAVTSWVVQNKVDYEIDSSMPVWDGA